MAVVRDHAPPDVSCWFSRGVNQSMRTGQPLERCLGLSTRNGGDHFGKRYFFLKRNQAWRKALTYCDGKKQIQRIEKLFNHIESFEKRFWPGHQRNKEPPKQWSGLRKQLFFYFRYAEMAGIRTSLSDRQYYEMAGHVDRPKKKEHLTISERIDLQMIKNAATK